MVGYFFLLVVFFLAGAFLGADFVESFFTPMSSKQSSKVKSLASFQPFGIL